MDYQPPAFSSNEAEQDPQGDVFSQRPKTLRSSLEVMVLEIFERLRLRSLNEERIAIEKRRIYEMIEKVSLSIRYNLRGDSERLALLGELFSLERDIRKEDVECWKDIVMVMHTLLPVWQAHEQARERAKLLEDVSG